MTLVPVAFDVKVMFVFSQMAPVGFAVIVADVIISLAVTAAVVACGLPTLVGTPEPSTAPSSSSAKLLLLVKSEAVNVPAPSTASGQPSSSLSVSK